MEAQIALHFGLKCVTIRVSKISVYRKWHIFLDYYYYYYYFRDVEQRKVQRFTTL